MKIKCAKIFFAFFMAILSLFGSCSFSSDNDSSRANPLGTTKARLFVSVNNNSARTILPDTLTEADIININLLITNTSTSDSMMWSWNSDSESGKTAISQMKADNQVFIDPGTYDFTLNLSTSKGLCQSGSLLNKVVEAGDNSLAFTTKYVTDSTGLGEFYIILNWASTDKIGQINAGLFTEESNGETPFYAMSPLTISSTSAVYAKNSVSVGTYFIRFDIYDTAAEKLNTIEDVIRIVSGQRTSSTISLTNLNTLYTVNYNLNGGEWADASYAPVTKRNARKIVTLPTAADIKRSGFIFDGWYEMDDDGTSFKGEAVTSIGAGTARDLDLYAKWTEQNEFYVSAFPAGNDSSGNGTEEKPFATLEKAVSVIKDNNDSSKDYKIWITGTLNENALISDIVASSLTISGTAGASLYELNGDTDGDGNGDGTVLTVQTAVPVTIENIKITGGLANGGGGLFVGAGASVTLSSGAVISENQSTSNGGGVYVSSGTLFMTGGKISGNTAIMSGGGIYNTGTVFMSGDAVIGDKSAILAASALSFSNSSGASNHGGGICTEGNLYIGYKDETTVDSSFTGGIFYNYSAHHGGGIYSSGTSNVIKIAAGSVAYNGTFSDGGGIRLGGTGDKLEVSGGEIKGNKSNLGSGIGGGGIYIGGGSSAEMTGGEVCGNSVAATGYMGNGIYANSLSGLKLGGNVKFDSTDDIYLKDIAIELVSALSNTSVATITPEAYVHGTTTVLSGTTVGTEYTKFAVTPRGTEHWSISSSGTLIQSIVSGITITVPEYESDDLELTVTESGTDYVFTAKEGYVSYLWTVAGQIAPSTTYTVTIPKTGLPLTNVLMLVARDSNGKVHEAKCTFTVTD